MKLHKWVGYSITAWAKIEEGLFEPCWRSLGSSKERADTMIVQVVITGMVLGFLLYWILHHLLRLGFEIKKEGNGSADNHSPLDDQRNAGPAEEMLPKKTGTTQHDLFIVSNSEK